MVRTAWAVGNDPSANRVGRFVTKSILAGCGYRRTRNDEPIPGTASRLANKRLTDYSKPQIFDRDAAGNQIPELLGRMTSGLAFRGMLAVRRCHAQVRKTGRQPEVWVQLYPVCHWDSNSRATASAASSWARPLGCISIGCTMRS